MLVQSVGIAYRCITLVICIIISISKGMSLADVNDVQGPKTDFLNCPPQGIDKLSNHQIGLILFRKI
jgi:hypothetical protein